MIKVFVVALVILIIPLLSDRINITIEKSQDINVRIDTTLLSFSVKRETKSGSTMNILRNIRHLFPAAGYLIRNSKIFYDFQPNFKSKLVIETYVIILPISLTIFLYSKAKDAITERIKNAG